MDFKLSVSREFKIHTLPMEGRIDFHIIAANEFRDLLIYL